MESVSFRPSDVGEALLLLTWEKLTQKVGSDELDIRQKLVAGLLCTDERMKAVWRVVFQTNAAGGFSYPAKFEALNPYLNALQLVNERIEVLKRLSDDNSAAELRTMLGLRASYLEPGEWAALRIANMTPFGRQLLASRYLYVAVIDGVGNAAVVNDADLNDLSRSLEETRK